jgi:Na+-transporting methylmalonyl-CoA/oxaloacetate decarboxylase beta subunit
MKVSQNPLSNLTIDYWYKLLPVIASVTLVLSLTVELQGVTNTFVQIASIGVIFIGIGEWINHPLQTKLAYNLKITNRNRINTFWGNMWDVAGVGLVIYAFKFL